MSKSDLEKREKKIRDGLYEATAVIDDEVERQKAECPGIPWGSIRQSITRGNTNEVAVALFLIDKRRQSEAA
jgi:hypothetical protein